MAITQVCVCSPRQPLLQRSDDVNSNTLTQAAYVETGSRICEVLRLRESVHPWERRGGLGLAGGGAREKLGPKFCVVDCVVTLASLPVSRQFTPCRSSTDDGQRTCTKPVWTLPLDVIRTSSVSRRLGQG